MKDPFGLCSPAFVSDLTPMMLRLEIFWFCKAGCEQKLGLYDVSSINTKYFMIFTRGDHFRFGSVFTQKKQPNRKKKEKKKRPETEPEPAQTGRFRSGFLSKKPDKPICIFWALSSSLTTAVTKSPPILCFDPVTISLYHHYQPWAPSSLILAVVDLLIKLEKRKQNLED